MKAKKIIGQYWIGILAVILLISVIFSSVEIYKEEVLKIDPDIKYVNHTTMNIPADYVDTLNPILSKSKDVFYISKLIYESLFEYDENIGLRPKLVEEYEINNDGNGVKITLKDEVKWHNGKPLTASDVIFTINAMRMAGMECPYYEKIKKIHSFYTMGEKTVMIFFRFKTDCGLNNLTFPILNHSSFLSVRDAALTRNGFKPVGTGKYMFKSFNSKKKLKLIPFDGYHGEKAKNKVNFVFMPDTSLGRNLMDIKEVTCYIDDKVNRKANLNNEDYTIFDIVSNKVDFVVFNEKRNLIKEKSFRQGICYAIDAKHVLENAYMGDGKLTETIYFPNFLGVDNEVNFYYYDEKKAVKHMNKLGLKDFNDDGYLENIKGQNIELKLLVRKNQPMRNSAAKMIKKTLKRIGIGVKILSLKKPEYDEAIKKGDFDMLLTGLTVDESYDFTFMFDGNNAWKYSNPNISLKSKEFKKLYRISEYKDKYIELKKELVEQVPYYPICYKQMSLVGVANFNAPQIPMFNNIYSGIETWNYDEVKSEKK